MLRGAATPTESAGQRFAPSPQSRTDCKKWWRKAVVIVAVRRIRAHDARRQPFERREENSIPGPHAGLASFAEDAVQKSLMKIGRIRKTNTRRKFVVFRWSQRAWHSRIAGKDKPRWCIRVHPRLLAQHQRLQLIVFLAPRRQHIPPQSVQCQCRPHLPCILSMQPNVFVAIVKTPRFRLVTVAWNAQQKIREV
jgi:hypothetical protein